MDVNVFECDGECVVGAGCCFSVDGEVAVAVVVFEAYVVADDVFGEEFYSRGGDGPDCVIDDGMGLAQRDVGLCLAEGILELDYGHELRGYVVASV